MLISFSVENYKSFRDRIELSMIPGKSTRLSSHIVGSNRRNEIKALKSALIYGANASGKSNVIHAMKFAQDLILEGLRAQKRIPLDTFRLDETRTSSPSRFEFEIKAGGENYAYGFSLTKEKILEEWLYVISKDEDKRIFERKATVEFDFSGLDEWEETDDAFLDFVGKGTPPNRLFLRECIERNVISNIRNTHHISNVYEWFGDKLNIIFPGSKYGGLEIEIGSSEDTWLEREKYSRLLRSFDTGIGEIKVKKSSINIESLRPDVMQRLERDMDESDELLVSSASNKRFLLKKEQNGEISVHKLVVSRNSSSGIAVEFELNEESDGTQRLMDLAPGVLDLFRGERVYVIDEVDRSLHPEITYAIFSSFLAAEKTGHSQLIATTHETCLLNQELFRKDEIWFTQKDDDGATSLYSLEEFKPRFDKDIRKDYLLGRFGGVPNLPRRRELDWLWEDGERE